MSMVRTTRTSRRIDGAFEGLEKQLSEGLPLNRESGKALQKLGEALTWAHKAERFAREEPPRDPR